jgi:hypothetical protein
MKASEVDKLRAYLRRWLTSRPYGWNQRTAQDLAAEFLQDAAFTDIRLAGFFASPDGQVVTAIVKQVLPYPYNVGVPLLVEAIMLAAQKRTNRQIGNTLLGVGAGTLILWGLFTLK